MLTVSPGNTILKCDPVQESQAFGQYELPTIRGCEQFERLCKAGKMQIHFIFGEVVDFMCAFLSRSVSPAYLLASSSFQTIVGTRWDV